MTRLNDCNANNDSKAGNLLKPGMMALLQVKKSPDMIAVAKSAHKVNN